MNTLMANTIILEETGRDNCPPSSRDVLLVSLLFYCILTTVGYNYSFWLSHLLIVFQFGDKGFSSSEALQGIIKNIMKIT